MEEQAQNIYNDSLLKRNQAEESAYRRELVKLEQTYQTLQNRLLELSIPWATAQAGAALKFGSKAAPLSLFMRSGGGPIIGALRGLGG